MQFNCNCWASPTCTHGSSAVTVVIRDCELARPVGSVVDGLTNSRALKVCTLLMLSTVIMMSCHVQLLGPLHKYKRAEVVYDDLDLAIVIIKLLTDITGNNVCIRKLVSNSDG